MKYLISVLTVMLLAGCQTLQPIQPEPEPVVVVVPEQEIIHPEPEPIPESRLIIADDAATLQAWIYYRVSLLNNLNLEKDSLNSQLEPDDVWRLKRLLLQLHPDTPYATRLRIQTLLTEQLNALPDGLSALFSWDLAFNQKLLEAESAVSALTRLNAQQHDTVDRLQKTNAELQKKIDALTQIEAQLNQPVKEDNNNNGQR